MVYLVLHPNLNTTALVHAPATEKARTTFLDYLERNGQISRADRQYWRKNMVAEKMEDPYDVTADVELYYGYEESGQGPVMPSEQSRAPRPTRGDLDEAAFDSVFRQYETGKFVPREVDESEGVIGGEELEEVEPQRPTQKTIEEVAKGTPRSLSPIARKALEGYIG